MASKKTLSAKNLEALGAARLAELLMDFSQGNIHIKRRLRLELADAMGASDLANEIRKTLAAIDKSQSFLEGPKRKALIADLQLQHRTIVERVARIDAAEALDLMWRFMDLANGVLDRCDDSSGTFIGLFHAACDDLEWVAEAAKPDPVQLSDKAYRALTENHCGQYDYLIEALIPALGTTGLDHLKGLFIEASNGQQSKLVDEDHGNVGQDEDGPFYAVIYGEAPRDITTQFALQKIADAQGDVDGYIAQQSEQSRTVPMVASRIAQRLLAAGRTDDAWNAIEAADKKDSRRVPHEWEQVRLDVLEALGRDEEAQAFRLYCFERSLSATHLRSYLKRLPDFEDAAAEERALSHVKDFPNVHQALAFLVSWPALDQAANVVLFRSDELDGNYYELLGPAADALEEKHRLASIVLRRALIDFTMVKARSTRYRHAARHLRECEGLDQLIGDYRQFETHDAYLARLHAQHSRKSAFWTLLSSE